MHQVISLPPSKPEHPRGKRYDQRSIWGRRPKHQWRLLHSGQSGRRQHPQISAWNFLRAPRLFREEASKRRENRHTAVSSGPCANIAHISSECCSRT